MVYWVPVRRRAGARIGVVFEKARGEDPTWLGLGNPAPRLERATP